MDESTYNNVYRNASPMTPSTPNNAFQSNVNRTKTRKWVEAKKQNYDGDDWGNDFEDDDEEPEEQPQLPPPKPTAGLRQIGQDVQPTGPQSSGNRSFSQPTAAFGHIRGESFGRISSGAPALHIQTQQPVSSMRAEPVETSSLSDTPTLGGATGHRSPESITSPQAGNPRPYVPDPAYPGRREYSPAAQDGASPALATTGPTSSRFPPRKSSMGQQDAPLYGDMSGDRSRSGSSSRPWMEPRANSPGRQAPSAGPPNKPLPFIRPADIYRRMEEEKEKERRSLDSAGRPSLDSIQGNGSDRSSSPANATRHPVDHRRRTSFDRDESLESSRGLKPTLAPVAERRSEYGLERLIQEGDKSEPADNATQGPETKQQEVFSSDPLAAPAPQSSSVQPLRRPEHGRKSISPRLPDLARLSGFGTDLFTGSSVFPDTEEATQPIFPVNKLNMDTVESEKHLEAGQTSVPPDMQPQVDDTKPGLGEEASTKQIGSDAHDTVHGASSPLEAPVVVGAEETAVPPRADSAEPANSPKSSLASEPQPDSARNEVTLAEETRPSRPLIPGGWVSESTNLGSGDTTPMERSEPVVSQLSPVQDVPEVLPAAGPETDDLAPTTAVKHAQSLETTPKANEMQVTQGQNEDQFGETTGKHDQAVANEVLAAESVSHPTPQTLPPLQTPSSLPVSYRTQDDDQVPPTSELNSSSNDSTATDLPTVTASSGFTPTAPLNPKRANASASEFVAPDSLARNFTMSSVDTASPHESDKLREDIIKSLSPVNSPGAFPIPSAPNTSIPTYPPDATRESRYLSGVYDDYIGFNEDKSLQETSQALKDESTSGDHGLIESSPARTIIPQEAASFMMSKVLPQSLEPGPSSERRFSWEKGAEGLGLHSLDDSQTPTYKAESSSQDAVSPPTASPRSQENGSPPALQIEPENAGTISHQVSVVSSHAPGGLGVAGIDPPSPISVMSGERSPGIMETRDRRVSLADEKVLIQASSVPVSPSPEEEHPALARTPPESPPVQDSANALAPPPKSVNITGWREILSLPSPALRIQKFDEARTQYSSMDSGLSNWLEHMRSLPDHTGPPTSLANASDLPALATAGHGPAQSSPTAASPPAQQPYYQQYLNASNPNLTSAPPGPARQTTGNLMSSGQPAASGFGTSKNQVGAKSKEFLHAAGVFGNKATKVGLKSGMKLFNKGKDKLRGSDKDFEEPQLPAQLSSSPPVTTSQTAKSRNERRSAWGLSWVGSRLQGRQGSSIHPNKHGRSSSFSLIQYLAHRDSRPASPAAPGLSGLARPPGTVAPSAPAGHLIKPQAAIDAYVSDFILTSAAAPPKPFSSPILNSPPQLHRTHSPFRPSPSRGSRPSSWLLSPRDGRLLPDSRRNSSSFAAPPAPRSPPRPELVSPISAASAPSPAPQKVQPDRDPKFQLPKPAPISKHQPTWDPYTASPLVEEEQFDLGTPAQARPLPSATFFITSDAEHLTTDDRLDGWVDTNRHYSTALRPSEPLDDLPRSMTAQLTASRPVASPLQYPGQESGSTEGPRMNSFVGLPPIRRTSTFGLLGGKQGQGDDGDSQGSPIAPSEEDVPPGPASMGPPATNGQAIPPNQFHYGHGQPQQQQHQQHPQAYSQQATAQNLYQGGYGNGQNGYDSRVQQGPNGFFAGQGAGQGASQNGSVAQQHTVFAPGPPQAQQPMMGRGGPVPKGPLSQFSAQGQAGPSPSPAQPSAQLGMRSGLPSPPAGGNPIHRFPPQGQWKLEESHLSEPLNTSRKTQSPPTQQQPGYYAEEKETGFTTPGGPAPAPQRTTRNTGLPPVSAQRFPGLFPAGSSNQSPVQQDQIQITPAAQQAQQQRRDSMGVSRSSTQDLDENRRQSGLLNQIGGKFLPHRGRSDSISKDAPAIQADDVSVSETSILTDEPREKKHKRASFFGLGSLGNNGPQPQLASTDQPPQQQSQQFAPSEKKKTFFGTGGLTKQVPNLGPGKIDSSSANNDANSNHTAGPKKRLSDLKGFLKGAPKDDYQPAKPELAQSNRPSMQGPVRPPAGGPVGIQGPQPGQYGPPQQYGQPGMMAPPPPVSRERSSTQGSIQGPPMGLPPNMGPLRPQHTGDGKERKPSTGGFLGNLFGNRPGSSAKDSKPQQGHQIPPPGQYQVQPGQMAPPGQQFTQRMVYPVQPGTPQGHPGQGSPFQGQPGAPGQFQPPLQIGQRPGNLGPQGPQGSIQQTGQLGSPQPAAIPGQGGVMLGMRQPSQTSFPVQGQQGTPLQQFSSEQRPGIPQPGPQSTQQPEQDFRQTLGSNPIIPSGEQQRTLVASADDFSRRSSGDQLSIGGSSILPRVAPNRKPVGSGPSRSTSGNIPTVQTEPLESQPATSKPENQPSKSPEPPNEFGGDGQQQHTEVSSFHQSPRLGAPPHDEHVRRPSLPTPSLSPAPMPGSPGANRRLSSQSGQPQASPLSQQQGFNDSPRQTQSGLGMGQDGAPSPMRIPSSVPQGQPGQPGQPSAPGFPQPGQAGRGQPAPSQGPGPQQGQPPQLWGFTRTGTQPPNITGPPGQQQPQHGQGGIAQEQKGTMSKLFGGGAKRRESGALQPSTPSQATQTKEKESTSSKLFGAFKRSKHHEQPQIQQQHLPQRQQVFPPMAQGAVTQGGRGQVPGQSIQPGQPMPPQMGQAGRGQPMPGAPPSQRPFGPAPVQQQGPPQGATQPGQFGRGQIPPSQVLNDRAQLPSQTRVGHGQISPAVIPMMQPNRSQTTVQRQEPQYAAVPIPRGYEAVHGYGVPNMVAHSPYNAGRASPPQQFGPQFQPMVPQHTGASQQFQPMMSQHTGASQQPHPMVPQHTGASQVDPRFPSPAPSQQVQSLHGQPQALGQMQAGVPLSNNQSPYSQQPPNQSQPQHLAPEHTGGPAPQQQFVRASPPVLQGPNQPHLQQTHVDPRGSPQQHLEQGTFLNPPSVRESEQDSSSQTQSEPASTESDNNAQLPRSQPQHILTSVDQPSSQYQVQHASSPQNQPLPDSATTFSPINTATGKLSDPPLPPSTSTQGLYSQESVKNVHHTPSPPTTTAGTGHPGIRHVVSNFSVVNEPRSNSLSPDVAPHRTFSVSPEPPGPGPAPARQPSNTNLNVNVIKANSHTPDHDDMYDATPRNEQAPRPQQVPIQNGAHNHSDHVRNGVAGAALAGGAAAGLAVGALASGDVSRTSSYQSEQPQTAILAQNQAVEPEEKILVDEPVELAAVNDYGDDLPMMSATSYPGQEWNPYGAGEFGDWE